MIQIIRLSICLLIYGFQDSTVWYENEKEVGTVTLEFCKETGTARLAIVFHTAKLKKTHWSLSDSRSMPDSRVGMQSDYPCLLFIKYVCRDFEGFMHTTVTDKYIPPAGLICIWNTPSWSVLKLWCSQKSTSYHWKYVYVVQTKFYTCYLLKVWALLVRKLLFNYPKLFILNHR